MRLLLTIIIGIMIFIAHALLYILPVDNTIAVKCPLSFLVTSLLYFPVMYIYYTTKQTF